MITIIVVLVSVAVPAFVGMLRSTNQALANSNFRIALASARDTAVRSAGLNDSAAVFSYEPGGRTSIITCIAVGQLDGRTTWVIDPLTEAVQLPPGWMVGGYASAGMIDDGDPAATTTNDFDSMWYESTDDRYDPAVDNWVFPETGFFRTTNSAGRDTTPGERGEYRQTFMVRFDGRTGGVALDDRTEGLCFMPDLSLGRGEQAWRQRSSPWSDAQYRMDGELDQAAYMRRLLSRPWPDNQRDTRNQLVGPVSTDTVLVKPVSLLALYNMRDLAQEIAREQNPTGFRGVNRVTGSLYEPPTNATSPDYTLPWAEEINRAIPSVARLFTVDRYNGGVVEVTP